MPTKAAAHGKPARPSGKRKQAAAAAPPSAEEQDQRAEADDWMEAEDDSSRLEEGEMEILLTGHAATHGIEGEDNWLIETEEESWGER